jgi:alpha-1,6-mannosyltransferase
MHLVDTTMFYGAHSGGVRSYLEAKHLWLGRRTDHRHSLVVPGERLEVDGDSYRVPAPPLPFSQGYRFPLREDAWSACVAGLRPDLIEAGDPYLPARSALLVGQRLGVPVIGFYHSDVTRLIAARAGAWTHRPVRAYVRGFVPSFRRGAGTQPCHGAPAAGLRCRPCPRPAPRRGYGPVPPQPA